MILKSKGDLFIKYRKRYDDIVNSNDGAIGKGKELRLLTSEMKAILNTVKNDFEWRRRNKDVINLYHAISDIVLKGGKHNNL